MDFGSQRGVQEPKIKSSKQLELHVATVYNQVAAMIEQREDLQIQLPSEVPTAIERVNLIQSVLCFLLEEGSVHVPKPIASKNEHADNSDIFACKDCQNYEKNLQKLQGEIRNHIRTHQQLKLYQDGLEEKVQEFKKEKKTLEKKYDNLKKKYEEIKANASMHTDRINKFESENQKLKSQLKHYRSAVRGEDPRKLNRYESNKENLHEFRNLKYERPSADRRPESNEKMRVSVNVKSFKGIPVSSKIMQEKHRDEKNKVIRNRIGFGY